jgi:uroporphyrin-III C-methyltransferase
MSGPGRVYLVGAGPGDPELISLKGVKCLQKADTVIYDRLVSAELFAYVSPEAELVYVGKEPGHHPFRQDQINALMVAHASQGKTVVRLKGGDPFVFGRGGEECLALAGAGIHFEVVPGISSAIAAPAYAGIPVTYRNIARSFTVVTGQTSEEQPGGVDWDDLPLHGTLVILMGMQNLPWIAGRLIQDGRPADTPAAVIHWGTTDSQQAVMGTLADIAEKSSGFPPPAVIVIGEVVQLCEQIGWFSPASYPIPKNSPLSLIVQE